MIFVWSWPGEIVSVMFVWPWPGEIDSVMFVWTWPGEVNSVMFVWAWSGEVNRDVCVNVTRWEKHCSTMCCSKGITTRLHSTPYQTLCDSLFRKTTLTDACSLLCPMTCKSPTEWAWVGRFVVVNITTLLLSHFVIVCVYQWHYCTRNPLEQWSFFSGWPCAVQ